MISTVVIGGIFVLWSWVDVVGDNWSTKKGWKIPTALYPFSMLVVWNSIAFMFLGSATMRRISGGQDAALCLILAGTGFAFLWATRVLVRRNSGPGTKLVALGSKILVVTSTVCFVFMILGIPDLWRV